MIAEIIGIQATPWQEQIAASVFLAGRGDERTLGRQVDRQTVNAILDWLSILPEAWARELCCEIVAGHRGACD